MELRSGFKQTEVGVIPTDWAVQTVESVLSEISMGPFGSDIKVSNFVHIGVPVLSGVNVRCERLQDSFTNFVTPAKAKSLKKAVAIRGDIVVTHRGTLGQISYIPHDSAFDRYVISQSQFRARFKSNLVLPSWVTLYFLSAQGSAKLLEGKGQTGVPALAQATTKFRQLNIPLPSLIEQRAIVIALSDLDALLSKLDVLIAKKRDLKVATMQQLLTGQTRLPGFRGDWVVRAIKSIVQSPVTDGPHMTPRFLETGIPFLSVNNLVNNKVDLGDLRFISQRDHEEFSKKCKPRRGDLLLGKAASVGKVAIVDTDIEFNIWSPIALIRVGIENIPRFIYYQLQSASLIRQIALLTNSSSQGNIGMSDIEKLELQLPKFDEQTAIAKVLSDMDAEITALEARRDKTRALKQGMMQELLTGRIRLV